MVIEEEKTPKKRLRISDTKILVLGYLGIILTGSLLLSMPFSNKSGVWTPYIDALFTATSATCVTGLVLHDVFEYWNTFGQIVILLLIQTGGVGLMTVVTLFAMSLRRKIGLKSRTLIAQSAGSMQIGSVVKLVRRIIIGTFIFELCGTALLAVAFCRDFGFGQGLYFALFHSVSAFCNAGFDLMGASGTSFISFENYRGDALVNLTLMALIILGGLGFIVWEDILKNRFRFKKYMLHTKVVLIATCALITVPALLFFIFEHNGVMKDMSAGETILACLFQSVTTRTAGFATLPQAAMSDSSHMLTVFLMFIGGSSGSTAGGIKITTLTVIIFGLISSMRNRNDITIGHHRLDLSLAKQAMSLMTIYIAAIFVSSLIICAAEPYNAVSVVFEVTSAIGTVGLTTGITPSLHFISKLVLTLMMFAGKVGALTLALAIAEKGEGDVVKRPIEKIMIG